MTSRTPGLPRPIAGEWKLDRSNALLAEARRLIPGVTHASGGLQTAGSQVASS